MKGFFVRKWRKLVETSTIDFEPVNRFFFTIKHAVYYCSKFCRMIHLFQMSEFMTDYIIHRKSWHFYESSIESDIFLTGTCSSSGFGISDDNFIQRESIFLFLNLESSCCEKLFRIAFVPLQLGFTLKEIRAGSDYFILIIQDWLLGMFSTFFNIPKLPMEEDFIRSNSRSSDNIPFHRPSSTNDFFVRNK